VRVLLADALDPSAVAALEAAGCEVVAEPERTAEDLADHIAGYDVLVVRSTKVTAATLERADRLSLVVRAGAGVENIDLDAASSLGIHVSNVPGRNAIAVAELTLGLLLAIDRRIPDGVADLRGGHWRKLDYSIADGLFGKTLGIVGLGDIGLAVAERAKAFGLTVLGLRRVRRGEAEARVRSVGVRLVDTLEELFGASDIVSLHIPGGAETQGLIGADLLGRLRPGAILLNTARGDVVDPAALLAALDGGLRAGLDVYPDEPKSGNAEFASAIASHPNVVGTHHIGASTEQAQRAIAAGVVEVILAMREGSPLHCVNLETGPLGHGILQVRHLDRVGVLAAVLDILRRGEINVEHMENRVFRGRTAAVATIHVAGDVGGQLLADVRALPDVLGAELVAS
jgi:D-3-phosphoglycerate dehydrogenase / 2-oxoglutarate reductase